MSRPRAPFSMTLALPAEIRKKGKWYVACCPAFDVVTQGETAAKAKENLRDALREFLLSCFERQTIDAVLRAAGLMPVSEYLPQAKPSKLRNVVPMEVEVPFIRQIPAGHPATC